MTTQEGTQKLIATQIATMTSVEADSDSKLPSRIHLLRVGTFPTQKYGTLEITASDLQDFVKNFKDGHGRPGPDGAKGGLPVNASHNKGGAAAAWINDLAVDGDDLWGTDIEWTGFGKSEVEAGNFKYISSEFTPRCLGGVWASAEGLVKGIVNVFTGAALTNIPMFNGNKGILASAESEETGDHKQVIYINAHAEKEPSMNIDELRVKNLADLTTDEKTFVEANAESLSAAEKQKFGIEAKAPQTVEASAVTAEMGTVSVEASEIVALRERAEKAEQAVEAANAGKSELEKTVEAHAKQLKENRRKEIEASVATHVKRGAIVADQATTWADKIEADASMEDMLKGLNGNKTIEAANLGADDQGNGSVSAAEQVDNKAQELMKEDKNLKYGDAVSKVLASDEGLSELYKNESTTAVVA